MNALVGPALFPFTLAAIVMAGLVLVEAASLLIGHSVSGQVDALLGHETDHAPPHGLGAHPHSDHGLHPGDWLSWINIGRVPFLIMLIVGLAAFAVLGFLIQGLASAALAPLPAAAAAAVAAVLTAPVMRISSRAIARIVPRDETYVVADTDLVGSTAEVTLGPVDGGLPGQVRAVDRYGNTHFLRARAAAGAPVMATGARVLLVDTADGVFVAIPAASDL